MEVISSFHFKTLRGKQDPNLASEFYRETLFETNNLISKLHNKGKRIYGNNTKAVWKLKRNRRSNGTNRIKNEYFCLIEPASIETDSQNIIFFSEDQGFRTCTSLPLTFVRNEHLDEKVCQNWHNQNSGNLQIVREKKENIPDVHSRIKEKCTRTISSNVQKVTKAKLRTVYFTPVVNTPFPNLIIRKVRRNRPVVRAPAGWIQVPTISTHKKCVWFLMESPMKGNCFTAFCECVLERCPSGYFLVPHTADQKIDNVSFMLEKVTSHSQVLAWKSWQTCAVPTCFSFKNNLRFLQCSGKQILHFVDKKISADFMPGETTRVATNVLGAPIVTKLCPLVRGKQ